MLPIARACCRRPPVSATRQFLTSAIRRETSTTPEGSKHDHAVIFSGIQPTGIPHLGNYLGAMRQWKRLQDMAGDEDKLIFSIVDLHAITMPQNAEELRYRRREMLAALLAIGLDPKKSTLFYQSSVMQHSELMWILSCTASMGYLSRMTQYKSKLQADNKAGPLDDAISSRLKLGLFSYPVLQAADILVHRATHVPVGDDQRQHLEFARECVTNFNSTWKQELFVYPETITAPSPRVMSLRYPLRKMSKSSATPKSNILITSTPEEIRERIMGAVTDFLVNEVTYEPQERPGVANLLELIVQCSPEPTTPADVARSLIGATLADLKALCANTVIAELSGIRERYSELLQREGGKYLDDIEAAGAEVARQNAEETMVLVRNAVGLSPPGELDLSPLLSDEASM
ncbi:tryptophanyl-tRNA synthetase [Xylaria telfairii]|nr:tryptophanyl-tRNA synthetase [Xylaria telfairii]